MKRRVQFSAARILLGATILLAMVLFATWIYIAQPSFRSNAPTEFEIEANRLKRHVTALSREFHPRNHAEVENLEAAAQYIEGHFRGAGAKLSSQDCSIGERTYRNVIGTIGAGKGGKIIIGAHYDSCADTPGADDNASGVAGLIELAYLFGADPPDREIEIVAYTLEEPPYFGTERMGSFRHAEATAAATEAVVGVIVLEMIGYFSNEPGSQGYPSIFLSLMYPNRGNFIAVVGNLGQRSFTKAVKVGMKGTTDLPVYSLNAPSIVPGVDFSDHRNYWPYGIDAVMITDTAFYRNKAYHTMGDTAGRLNCEAMADVTAAVYEAVLGISEP
ncbi:MAG: M28 family peptidase [Verrucomicrobiota bacterium]